MTFCTHGPATRVAKDPLDFAIIKFGRLTLLTIPKH